MNDAARSRRTGRSWLCSSSARSRERMCRRCCWCTATRTTIRCSCPPSVTWPGSHHVVAYDTRNAGASSVPGLPGDFTLKTLVDDMFAVLAAVGATDVHLVGHDWGSIQGWAAVQDRRAAGADRPVHDHLGPGPAAFCPLGAGPVFAAPRVAAAGRATGPQLVHRRVPRAEAAGGRLAPVPHQTL